MRKNTDNENYREYFQTIVACASEIGPPYEGMFLEIFKLKSVCLMSVMS